MIKALKERSPLVDTYIQNMKPDPVLVQVPESDWHSLARVDFGKVIGNTGYATDKTREKGKDGKLGFLKHSLGFITGLSASLHLTYHESGFVRMIVIDTDGPNGDGFNRQNYTFGFVRNEFLGTIPTIVLDVQPVKKKAGRFFGRVWVERNGGNIVRYNGDLAGSQAGHYGVLPLRLLAHQRDRRPVAADLGSTPKRPTQSLHRMRCSSKRSATSGAMN